MNQQPDTAPPPPGLLTPLPPALRWGLLAVLTGLLSFTIDAAGLPAAVLLGSTVAGVLFGTNGARLSVPQLPYLAAQAILGCLVAKLVGPDAVDVFVESWLLFTLVVLVMIAATTLSGYVLARMRILPGTTAIWGTSAGAASAMIMMAESFGADPRLVAFMQYLRVASVMSIASVIAAFVFDIGGPAASAASWFPPVDWISLFLTLAVALASALAGHVLRIPSGALLMPMLVAGVLHVAGVLPIELPPWLLAGAFVVLGWRIGLGFTRRLLRHAVSVLPQVMASIVILIAFCAAIGLWLTWQFGIDPLSAYLATSPGGIDTVIIIAASTPVDVPFVVTMQTLRVVMILVLGPWISRFVARRI